MSAIKNGRRRRAQRQVMELRRKAGLSNREIARRLDIAAKTVENHCA